MFTPDGRGSRKLQGKACDVHNKVQVEAQKKKCKLWEKTRKNNEITQKFAKYATNLQLLYGFSLQKNCKKYAKQGGKKYEKLGYS